MPASNLDYYNQLKQLVENKGTMPAYLYHAELLKLRQKINQSVLNHTDTHFESDNILHKAKNLLDIS